MNQVQQQQLKRRVKSTVSGFANVAGFFSDSAKSNKTVTYEMQAQPEVYKNIVIGMLAASSKELALNMEHYKSRLATKE